MTTTSNRDQSSARVVPRRPQRFSLSDWKQVMGHVRTAMAEHHLSIVAPGVAFYLMFALVPGMVALVSIYGLVADPADVQQHFTGAQEVMPDEAYQLLETQLNQITGAQGAAGLGALFGILLALWASSRATLALMQGLNITYGTDESRGLLRKAAVRLGLTVFAVLLGIIAIGIIVVLPPVLAALPLPGGVTTALSMLRWPLMLVLGMCGLAILYRYAPDRVQPRLRWLSWGSAVAAVTWVVASILFSVYVANFGNFDETYGALGAIIIMLMWLLLSAYAVLLGAEIDAAFERQTDLREGDSQAGTAAGHVDP